MRDIYVKFSFLEFARVCVRVTYLIKLHIGMVKLGILQIQRERSALYLSKF